LQYVEGKAKMRLLRSSDEGNVSTTGGGSRGDDSAIAKTGTGSYDDQTAATAIIHGDPYSGDIRKAIPVDEDNYSDHSDFSSDESSEDSVSSDEETKLDSTRNTRTDARRRKRKEASNLKAKYNPLKALKAGRDLESYQQNKLLLHKEAKKRIHAFHRSLIKYRNTLKYREQAKGLDSMWALMMVNTRNAGGGPGAKKGSNKFSFEAKAESVHSEELEVTLSSSGKSLTFMRSLPASLRGPELLRIFALAAWMDYGHARYGCSSGSSLVLGGRG
jgi:hypothetical protein